VHNSLCGKKIVGKEQDVYIKNNDASCKLRVGEELKKSAIDRVENHEFKTFDIES